MEPSPVIVCNPGFGNAPYLQSLGIALAVNDILDEPRQIVMPLIYEERQRRITEDEYGTDLLIIFDAELGQLYQQLLYKGNGYEAYLKHWLNNVDNVSTAAQAHIQTMYPNVECEIARSPQLKLNQERSYCSLFARQSTILHRAKDIPETKLDPELLEACSQKFAELEKQFTQCFITQPGTFAEVETGDIAIPLTMSATKATADVPSISAYVTVSGIPHLSLHTEWSLPLYTNDANRLTGATEASPHILNHPNIAVHFARAGWGSVWASLLSETPLVTPSWDTSDDPEIYYNIERLKELGLCLVYSTQPETEILQWAKEVKPTYAAYKKALEEEYGTLSGNVYMAEKIVTMHSW